MGVSVLNPKNRRRCEAILGAPLIWVTTTGEHYHARCWVDQHHAAVVNYRTGAIVEPVTHQGIYVANRAGLLADEKRDGRMSQEADDELEYLRDVLRRIDALLDATDWLDTDLHGPTLLAIQSLVLGALYKKV